MKESWYEGIFKKRMGDIKPGLDRMRSALAKVQGKEKGPLVLLVGGTNGKGSTAGLLYWLLSAAGVDVGLFSSPHLVSFRERFVRRDLASHDQILSALAEIKNLVGEKLYEDLTFFELATLIAVRLFREADLAIFEVGLGGRLDATNVLDPELSLIVSIGFDHTEYLGDTIEAIMLEKLGIARKGKPLVLGKMAYPAAESLALNFCETEGVPLLRGQFSFEFPAFLKQAPDYLQENFKLAATAYDHLAKHWRPLPEIKNLGLNEASLPPTLVGRYQEFSWPVAGRNRSFLVDVCHNLDGAQAFTKALAAQYSGDCRLPLPGLVCILNDKDTCEMLDLLKGFLEPLVLFKIDSERCFSKEGLSERHREIPVADCFADALALLPEGEMKDSKPIVVCGSVLAIGKVIEYFSPSTRLPIHHSPARGRSPRGSGR